MRPLQRLEKDPLADFGKQRALGADLPEFAVQIVGRLTRPDLQHHVDGFEEHRVAVAVEVAEGLRVGQQAARTDAEDEAPIEHVIEHGDLCRDGSGMRVGHVHRAGAEADALGLGCQGRQEHRAGGDVLGGVGHMLAAQRLREAELIGQHEGFRVFPKALAPVLADGVDRHREKSELHGGSPVEKIRAGRQSLSCCLAANSHASQAEHTV